MVRVLCISTPKCCNRYCSQTKRRDIAVPHSRHKRMHKHRWPCCCILHHVDPKVLEPSSELSHRRVLRRKTIDAPRLGPVWLKGQSQQDRLLVMRLLECWPIFLSEKNKKIKEALTPFKSPCTTFLSCR